MQVKPLARFTAFYAQGIIMSAPMFVIIAIDRIVQYNFGSLVIALYTILSVIYLLFALMGKPHAAVPVIVLRDSTTAIRLIAAGIGLMAVCIVLHKVTGTLQTAVLIIMFMSSIGLFTIAFIKVMIQE